MMPYQGEPQPDGRFKFTGVFPDVYQVIVAAAHCFVKRVLVDGEAQESSKVDLTRGKPKSIEVVVSSRVATLQAQVAGAGQHSTAITLLLQHENDENDLQFEAADEEGEATWELPPGKYRLYAFEDFDFDAWGNPAVVSAFAAKSLEIELHENQHARLEAPLISAAEFQQALERAGH